MKKRIGYKGVELMIIYTCPECGHDLKSEVLTCNPPIHKDYCPSCGWSHSHSEQEEVVRIPFGGNSLKMRDATSEEQKNIQEYIDEISEPTGINFYDLLGLKEPNFTELKYPFIRNNFENNACESCPSNPNNGGTGICFCTLGQQQIIY